MAGTVRPARCHNSVELVWTVCGLVEPEPLPEVGLHLEGVDVRKRLLRPRQNLPNCDTPGPDIAGRGELLLPGYALNPHPLHRSVLIVAEAVVVVGKDVARECRVTDLDRQRHRQETVARRNVFVDNVSLMEML